MVFNRLSSSLLSSNIKVKIHGTVILPVVWYGCETWSLILKEECRLGGNESRVLRKKRGHKGHEVAGEWNILYNEELNDLYSSPNIIRVIKSRRIRWAGHVASMEGRTGV